MAFDSLLLSAFYFFFLFLQVLIFRTPKLDVQFLKRGKDIKTSEILLATIVFLLGLIIVILFSAYLQIGIVDRFLYFYTFLFVTGIFITSFLTLQLKNTKLKLLLSIILAVTLVSLALLSQEETFKNIITVGSLLWVSPILFRYLKIERKYILFFLVIFTILDVYNVYILNPHIPTTYSYVVLNGYIEIGHRALGMGDFFLSFLALGLIYSDRGHKKALVLGFFMSLLLLIVNLLAFKHDIPFSIFVVVPTLFVYFLQKKNF